MQRVRRRSVWSLATSVPRQVLSHPGNKGHRVRALARAVGWQARKRLRSSPVRVHAYGLDLELPTWSGSLSNFFYFGEAFEWETVGFVRAYLRPGDIVVDAGANVGMFTYAAAEVVGRSGRVLAFEPTAPAADVLESNVERNNLSRVVDVRRAAVGAERGTASFTTDLDVSNHMVWIDGASISRESGVVPVVRLDDEVPNSGAALAKLDLEGAELLALDGFSGHLARGAVPVLIVEAHDHALRKMGSSRLELLDRLDALGYDRFYFDEGASELVPLDAEVRGDVIAVWRPALGSVVERLRSCP